MGEEAGELKSQRLSNSRPHPRPHKSAPAPCKMDFLCFHPEQLAGLWLLGSIHPPSSSGASPRWRCEGREDKTLRVVGDSYCFIPLTSESPLPHFAPLPCAPCNSSPLLLVLSRKVSVLWVF